MSTGTIDLGEIQGLARALGALDGSNNFRSDWLSRPGDYLSSVIADQTQRDALVEFVDEVLGGEERETDPDGLIWLPIVSHNAPHLTVYLVLDPRPADYVAIGVGARLTTSPTESKTSVHVPVFRTAKSGKTVPDVILIGQSDAAIIRLETEITFGTVPPLGGIGLSVHIPTTAGPSPQFALRLKRLQLPGASQPRDLNISVSNLDELDDAALELVLGLVRAQADQLGTGELDSLIGLLGLKSGAGIPNLPLDRLASEGVRAVASWFESVMSNATARSAWLNNLASLIGGAVSGDEITLTVGPAQVVFGVRVNAGSGGQTVVIPTLGVSITQGDVRVRAEADLLSLNLADFSARALPQLSLFAQLGKRADGSGNRILTGDPQVDALRVGVTLDQTRRPNFLLAADGVVISGHQYATLDLTMPDALAEVAGTVLGDIADDLLAQLGPIGETISLLVGLTPPPSAPGATTLELATFLRDPLTAVRSYWQGLLRDHPAGVTDLLAVLRDLLADAGQAATAITGSGTEADPWRTPLVGPVGLDVWRSSGGDVIEAAISASYVADTLGQRCTRVEARLSVGLFRIDLAAGSAVFLSFVEGRLTARARGSTQAQISVGPLTLTADHIGLAGRWRPSTGMSFEILAPNLAVKLDEVSLPFSLPVIAADGSLVLDAAGWGALEQLIGLLASAAPIPWVGDLATALGWRVTDASTSRPHLRLADLVVDPAAAIKNWFVALALDNDGLITDALEALARALTGSRSSFGRLAGRGVFEDPYRMPVMPVAGSPELAAWLLPDGPEALLSTAPEVLREWQPGSAGLVPAALAEALDAEAASANEIDDLVSGRPDLASGFALLVNRWTESDGRITPPSSDPAGVTVHRVDNVTVDRLAETIDLEDLLGVLPETVIRIAVVRRDAPLPWSGAPGDRIIDLRGAGLAPESFARPTAVAGEWFVALAERAEARLAAGDTDGVVGQAARLARVLDAFSSLPNVTLIARDAAGQATIAAANNLSFVSAVLTLGTPFGAVAFTILDDQPAADALRLLRVLLPAVDPDETDDPDLACGRGLVTALTDLLPLGDPGRELRPPVAPITPRAGLSIHAFFGVVDEPAILAGMTAIVAAGLSERAMRRAEMPRRPVTGARFGLRIPVAPGPTGVTVSGDALVELFGVDLVEGAPVVSTARSLALHLELRRAGGWLVGGPGVGLGAADRPTQELRWIEFNLRLPFNGGGGEAEIVLHEPSVFGIKRERWVVRPEGSVSAIPEIVTPALPEVRVLLSLLAEQLNAAAGSSPALDAALELFKAVGVMDASGGSVPDAINHLLHDPAVRIADALADAARRAALTSAVNQLLTGIPGVTVDLAGRRIVFDSAGSPGNLGMVSWTAHLEANSAGEVTAQVSLGSAGTTAAGGAIVRLETGPLRVTLEWHRPGLAAPEMIPLWPPPADVQILVRPLARLIPAECIRIGLEYLRSLDEAARPVIDAALDAIGLLAPEVNGEREVLLPAGLLQDPVGWFKHETAFGSAGGFSSARVIALIDALKPILGLTGDPGEWSLASGVVVAADSVDGNLRIGLRVNTGELVPIDTPAGRLIATGTFTLAIPPGAAPRPGILLSVGLSGAATGRQAVYVELGNAVRVFVRLETGADLELYPNPPGLGQLAETAVTRALPFILDELAALTGATFQGRVGEIVRAAGDGLNLRTGAPAHFDAARLQAWAADPVAALVAAIPTLTATALQSIANALSPALPAGVSASAAGGKVTVTAGSVSVSWQPSPLEFSCAGTIAGIPGVEQVSFAITLNSAGLRSLSAQVGPAAIDAGGLTLRPLISAVVGEAPAGGRRIQFGLAANAAGTRFVAARWNLDGAGFGLIAVDGATEHTDAEHVALALLEAVLDLVASLAIRTTAVQDLLAKSVGSSTVREVLRGVVLQDAPAPTQLDANLFDPSQLLGRVQKLAVNLAGANPSINIGGGLTVGLGKSGSIIQLTLGVNGRIPLFDDDIVVSIEADSRWIKNQPPARLAIGFLDSASMTFAPSLEVNGIGIRIGRSSGPLLNLGLSLGSVAVHLFGSVSAGGSLAGGVQLQLSDLAVAVSGAQGENPIAQGLMKDAGSGQNKLAPAFSPALAVQKHGGDPVMVSLRAGDGDGPWFIVIQKGFGPIYIEQVGFGVTVRQDQLERISLLLDGRVSLFGLTAAVDDLQVSFVVASDASLFDSSRWSVDLAGLAISADMGGVLLAGGLRKFTENNNVEYVGMLLGRFAVYGLSVYGGYASAVVNGERFASFFAFGAINGPIGGPPAFFLTGIGGGLGINRDLIFPTDLSRFGDFPFIKALDPGAKPSANPMEEIRGLRDIFPVRRGEFWFAAGISFTSFALVDGVAVISVKIGDGLEIALLGLARMALPRPQFPLVSIELGLIARFSTKEGVLWIQAQLTDNSWILHESVRLTGGFAFVTWFKGPNAGQFVVTMGGFHPNFHRDGYPDVPRLGFQWRFSDAIVVKGGSYFALTSEAVMAGGELTASADFGPAWAEVCFRANGIVYFDPFRFELEVSARISAGVTIDVWIGEITISVSLSARVTLKGPKFHGTATFDVGPVSLTVSFGDSGQSEKIFLTWEQFVRKYLEEAAPGVARVLTSIPGKGALPPGTGPGGATDTGTADGSAAKPFEVTSEFEITVTTTVPTERVRITGAETYHAPSRLIGVAPVNVNAANSRLILSLIDVNGADRLGVLLATVNKTGAYPVGVWGPPQSDDDRKVPSGDVIKAVDSVHFEARASLQGTLPKEVKYHQVDAGQRKPLPFVNIQASRPAFLGAADELSNLLPPANGGAATFGVAKPWLSRGGHSKTAVAAIERERAAAPRLGSLTQDLANSEVPTPNVNLREPGAQPPIDVRVYPPRAIAVLTSTVLPERPQVRTTVNVNIDQSIPRVAAPTFESVQAQLPLAIASKLVRVPTPAASRQSTMIATGAIPLTRAARGAAAAVAARGAFSDGQARLDAITGSLRGGNLEAASTQELRAGEIAVLQMPNADRDVGEAGPRPLLIVNGRARVIALSHGGDVLSDGLGTPQGLSIPARTERVAVLALGDNSGAASGLFGWHSGQELPYIGWNSAVAPGATVQAEGAQIQSTRQRFRAGWVSGADLVTGTTIVATRFAQAITVVLILIDDPIGSDAARGLSLTLEGAERAAEPDGQPIPPTVVVAGNRTALIYPIKPIQTDDVVPNPITVSVASQDDWHLAGVMGGAESVEATAARVTGNGLDGLVQPLVSGREGSVQIQWLEVEEKLRNKRK